jgi:hypothetical protein
MGSIAEVMHELEIEMETWESFVSPDDQSHASAIGTVKAKVLKGSGSIVSASMDSQAVNNAAPGDGDAMYDSIVSEMSSAGHALPKIEFRISGSSEPDNSSFSQNLERRDTETSLPTISKDENRNSYNAGSEPLASRKARRNIHSAAKSVESSSMVESDIVADETENTDNLMASI